MTEQPDTAAIRASYNPFLDPKCVLALCDALDAARANIERAHAHREGHALAAGEAITRAEAAEARIAAALAWFADTDCTWTYRVEMARRALTEGTGQ